MFSPRQIMCIKMILKDRMKVLVLSFMFVYFLLQIYLLKPTPVTPRSEKLKFHLEKLSTGQCHFPHLNIDDPSVKKFFKKPKAVDCEKRYEKNWVYIRNGTFYIDGQAEVRHGGKITCDYNNIQRLTEQIVKVNLEENFRNGSKLKGDFFKVNCQSHGTNASYSNYHAGIVQSEEAVERSKFKSMPRNALGLNVYMFGFDSLSRLGFIRNLPKMYKYLTETMDAVVLEGYNIVGDGTPQALIPILTGKTEVELPLTRKRFAIANYVDVYPWIWNDFRDAGYVTLYGEDASADRGTFTYRLKGFKDQPTDHYMRPFYTEFEKQSYISLCLGSEDQYRVHFDYIQHFWDAYPIDTPKFAFQFHSYYSHGKNLIHSADDYLVDHLKFFVDNGHWNNTIIIVMTDHGPRIDDLRATAQGKFEERLPFFSFAFPPWFKNQYPDNYRVFKENAARLTTPFDIHATLQEILNFDPSAKPSQVKNRSRSLFHPIPIDRTCDQAGIDVHWCTCLQWTEIPIDDPIVQLVASDLVKTINKKTLGDRNLCAEIKLSTIQKVRKYVPADEVLKYKGAKDLDGFVPDLSGKAPKFNLEYYQLDVWTEPGNAHYEASIAWNKIDQKSIVDLDVVSHINANGDQPHCIAQLDPALLKWCKCYDKI